VSVIRTLTGLARYGTYRFQIRTREASEEMAGEACKIMCAAAIVPTLLNLARRFNDFVTPTAIDLLCLLLDEGDINF